ncbi:MAG: hypothetical protein QOE90_3438 [Thermoplasmata archaeon]|jgi:hypothetical protein|nr:hypothetical protein [Thermoplasmata archaeon]
MADGEDDPRPRLRTFLARLFGRSKEGKNGTHRVEGYVPPHSTRVHQGDELDGGREE